MPTATNLKGHVAAADQLYEVARRHAIGNAKADLLAAKGVALRTVGDGNAETTVARWTAYTALARTVVSALSLWPHSRQACDGLLRRVVLQRERRALGARAEGHALRWVGGDNWACLKRRRRMANTVRKTSWPKWADPPAGLLAPLRGVAEGRQHRQRAVELRAASSTFAPSAGATPSKPPGSWRSRARATATGVRARS